LRTDRCGNTSGKECHAQVSRKEPKIQAFMYRYATNVEYEMCDYTGNNWRSRNSNKSSEEKFGSHTRKTFNRFTTKDSNIWNVT